MVEAVAAGEYDLGMTDTDDVWAVLKRGFDVEFAHFLDTPTSISSPE